MYKHVLSAQERVHPFRGRSASMRRQLTNLRCGRRRQTASVATWLHSETQNAVEVVNYHRFLRTSTFANKCADRPMAI